MKILKILLITILSIILIGGVGYLWASSGVKSKPGYVEFTPPSGSILDLQVAVRVGPHGMRPVRWLANKLTEGSQGRLEMPERVLKSVLPDVQGLQLRVYQVQDNRLEFDQAITDSVAMMRAQDWHMLLRVQEDEEHIVVMHSGGDNEIAGLSVLASTSDNAVFFNLIGPFDPEVIAAAAQDIQ